jgi:hypothetical protein
VATPAFQDLGQVLPRCEPDRFRGPQLQRPAQAARVAADHDHLGAAQTSERHQHQADRARADHREGLAFPQPAGFDAADDARERLHDCRLTEADPGRERQQVLAHHAGGHPGELGVGPVPELQVVAQARPAVLAPGANTTRGRVGDHHAGSGKNAHDPRADLFDDACHFVPEDGRRRDHAGVVAAAEDLDVRSAGEGGARPQQQLARLEARYLDPLDPHVLAAVEHGGPHLARHAAPCPSRITLSVPGDGRIASANASVARATGSRWLMISATRTARPNTSSAASCCSSIEEL